MMSRRTVAIDQQLNQILQRQMQENREKIKSIKTVVLCGQNAIPLRGERQGERPRQRDPYWEISSFVGFSC